MDKLTKNIICIVYSIFVIISFSSFAFGEIISKRYILNALFILFITALLVILPAIQKLEFKNPRMVLYGIACLSLIPRIIWVNLVHVIPKSDFYTYHTLAGAMAQGNLLYPKYVSLFPHVYGYSKVLSVFYTVFGSEPFTAVYLNIAINLGILFLIYFLGKQFYDVKTGLVASAIYAFWPSQFFYNTLVLTEPFYTFGVLAILCLYFTVMNRVKSKPALFMSFCGLGIAAGLLKYIRPASLIVVLSIIIHYLFIHLRFTGDKAKRALQLGVGIGLCMVLAVSYSLTSSVILKAVEKTINVDIARQSTGFNLFVGMNQNSNGRWSAEDSDHLQPMIDKGMSSTEIQDTFFNMGMERVKNIDLLSHIIHQLKKNKVMWGSDSESLGYTRLSFSPTSHIDLSRHHDWLSDTANVYYWVFFSLSFLAFFALRDNLSIHSLILYLYILGTVAVHMVVEVHGRYHYPVIPLLCVLASAVLTQNRVRPLPRPAIGRKC